MGSSHFNYGVNNQDSGFEYKTIFCVVDGCSGGKHSEIGAKLFAKKLQQKIQLKEKEQKPIQISIYDIKEVFEEIMNFIVDKTTEMTFLSDMTNFMCFTIMMCQKIGNYWYVGIFGDGVIITQDHEDQIEFIDINHSNTPHYLAYDYIDKKNINSKENLDQSSYFYRRFSDVDFKSIGIASDGLSYIIDSNYENEFKDLLLEKKDFKIKRFINKLNIQFQERNGFFKDDITIIME